MTLLRRCLAQAAHSGGEMHDAKVKEASDAILTPWELKVSAGPEAATEPVRACCT